MKKFQFSLNTVLSFKEQRLELLQNEHAAVLARVHEQEDLIQRMEDHYRMLSREYREQCSGGISIIEVRVKEGEFRALEQDIRREIEKLEQLHRQAEKKRAEVVEAKQDATSIEKLKGKKQKAYQKAVEKSEELFVEEFVNAVQIGGVSRSI